MKKLFSSIFNATALRYFLVAIGGLVVGSGWTSAEEWVSISGALMVLIPAIIGVIQSRTSRIVTSDGKMVTTKSLPVTVQREVKAAAEKVADARPGLFDFLRKK